MPEMVTGNPLFPGSSVDTQLYKIFKTLGTPTSEQYPGLENLPGYRSSFRRFRGKKLERLLIGLSPEGIDLLKVFFQMSSSKSAIFEIRSPPKN